MIRLVYTYKTTVDFSDHWYEKSAFRDSGVARAIAALIMIRYSGSSLYSHRVHLLDEQNYDILVDLRRKGLLNSYERDGTFFEYLSEVMLESRNDLSCFASDIENYDEKRGQMTVSAEIYLLEIGPRLPMEEIKKILSQTPGKWTTTSS
jgi:hypothetical protein